jgi:hypothetical protein
MNRYSAATYVLVIAVVVVVSFSMGEKKSEPHAVLETVVQDEEVSNQIADGASGEEQEIEHARAAYWSGYSRPFYALPIKCDGNNIAYSSEILEVRNLKFIESIEKPDATWLDYTVEIEIKDDYHYDGISLWFGVSDKHGNLYAYNDDPAIGMVFIDNVQQGDVREAKMSAFLKPGEFENGNAIEIVFLGCEVY